MNNGLNELAASLREGALSVRKYCEGLLERTVHATLKCTALAAPDQFGVFTRSVADTVALASVLADAGAIAPDVGVMQGARRRRRPSAAACALVRVGDRIRSRSVLRGHYRHRYGSLEKPTRRG